MRRCVLWGNFSSIWQIRQQEVSTDDFQSVESKLGRTTHAGSRDSELAVKGASFLLASMLAFAKTGNFSYDDGDGNENVKKN